MLIRPRVLVFVVAALLGSTSSFAAEGAKKTNKPPAGAAKKPGAGSKAAKKVDNTADMARAQEMFPPFCEEWMGKLAARERDNLLKRDFKATAAGYHGTYVGYSKEHGCTVSTDGTVPVGRVLYKEVTYSQEGATLDEAKVSTPQPIEIYEVTELFQFNHSKWSSE